MIKQELLEIIKKIVSNLDNKFWEKDFPKDKKILLSCVKLQEETGELAWEVLTQLGRARQEKIDNFSNQNLEFEFADVVLSLLVLAEKMDIDINNALKEKLDKIQKRGGF